MNKNEMIELLQEVKRGMHRNMFASRYDKYSVKVDEVINALDDLFNHAIIADSVEVDFNHKNLFVNTIDDNGQIQRDSRSIAYDNTKVVLYRGQYMFFDIDRVNDSSINFSDMKHGYYIESEKHHHGITEDTDIQECSSDELDLSGYDENDLLNDIMKL